MAIDFPNTPSNGQTYTQGSRTWKYDGEKWVVLNEYANSQNQIYDVLVMMHMETN